MPATTVPRERRVERRARPAPELPPLRRARMPTRLALRLLLWRARPLLVAAACAIAVLAGLRSLEPPRPATVPLVVAAADLAAGTRLAAADLRTVDVPVGLLARTPAVDGLVGRRTAVAVPLGAPLVGGVLAAAAPSGPPGTVVTAVRLSDVALAALLAPGTRVDLLAATPDTGPAAVVASGAVVVPSPSGTPAGSPGDGGGLLGGATGVGPADGTPLFVAVRADEAAALAGAAASAFLTAVVVP